MNYFFFTLREGLRCKVTIPRFQNSGLRQREARLWGARIVNDAWSFFPAPCSESDKFFVVEANKDNLHDIFFLATTDEIRKQEQQASLVKLGTFTDTTPEYRGNLEVSNTKGGFSSYQADYPYRMIKVRGSLYSSMASLVNFGDCSNHIFVRNVFAEPIHEFFNAYLFDDTEKKILRHERLVTNRSNCIDLAGIDLTNEVHLYCQGHLGIPIYCSEAPSGQLSFEHTHPPHEQVFGNFKLVKALKERTHEKILEAAS